MSNVFSNVECHGGDNCGIINLSGFSLEGQETTESLVEYLRNLSSKINSSYYFDDGYEFQRNDLINTVIDWDFGCEVCFEGSFLLEFTLIDQQLSKLKNWEKLFEENGVRLVTKFRNRNSGNIVNIFHYETNGKTV